MPELGFYFVDSDTSDVVQSCFEDGAFLIPDLNYDESKYVEIRDMSDFKNIRETRRSKLFHIVSSVYFECPLEMRPVMKEGVQKYFIAQKNGGPTIVLYCPSVFSKGGIEFIPPGSISYHSNYWNTQRREMASVPESLKAYYKKLTKAMKERSTIAQSDHRTFLVGQGATACLAEGAKLGGVFSK
jgi:hypothetical protein